MTAVTKDQIETHNYIIQSFHSLVMTPIHTGPLKQKTFLTKGQYLQFRYKNLTRIISLEWFF